MVGGEPREKERGGLSELELGRPCKNVIRCFSLALNSVCILNSGDGTCVAPSPLPSYGRSIFQSVVFGNILTHCVNLSQFVCP